MCFFRGDFNDTPPQRRSSTHSLSQTHTHTHTLTHMTGQQWLIGQVVPDFSGFANIFDPKEGRKFFDRQGVTQHPKIYFQSVKNVSFVYVYFV